MIEIIKKIKLYGFKQSMKYICEELFHIFWLQMFKKSFSQKGEDLVIDQLLGYKKKGFYVDIGAYDPTRFSNTKRFYLRGWTGINIDANPVLIKKFQEERKNDINLVLGIDEQNGLMTFNEFFPPALSTFSEKESKKYIQQGFKLIDKKQVQIKTLRYIFENYSNNQKIDFLSIDTEGMDLNVLKSNNWKKFRPQIVCVEINKNDRNISNYLENQGYILRHTNGLNSIFSVS